MVHRLFMEEFHEEVLVGGLVPVGDLSSFPLADGHDEGVLLVALEESLNLLNGEVPGVKPDASAQLRSR